MLTNVPFLPTAFKVSDKLGGTETNRNLYGPVSRISLRSDQHFPLVNLGQIEKIPGISKSLFNFFYFKKLKNLGSVLNGA